MTADTKAVEDYQTWKENTWTGKESIDSGKIVLTPGATEKDLNFCWYSVEKGTPKLVSTIRFAIEILAGIPSIVYGYHGDTQYAAGGKNC